MKIAVASLDGCLVSERMDCGDAFAASSTRLSVHPVPHLASSTTYTNLAPRAKDRQVRLLVYLSQGDGRTLFTCDILCSVYSHVTRFNM